MMKPKLTPEERAEIKAEKAAWKARMRLEHPELAEQGYSAEQIWKMTLMVNSHS